MVPMREFFTQDATFDVCFNESNENQLLSAGGDGVLRLWDLMHDKPINSWAGHKGEIFSCEWNHINKVKEDFNSLDKTTYRFF
jgi:peroxin-7